MMKLLLPILQARLYQPWIGLDGLTYFSGGMFGEEANAQITQDIQILYVAQQ